MNAQDIKNGFAICTKCGIKYELKDFYKNKSSIYGYASQCKHCGLKQTKSYGKVRQRLWSRTYRQKHKDTIAQKMKQLWKDKPLELKARNRLGQVLRSKKLRKRNSCEICLESENVAAHHHDYSLPLDIIWLCTSCHKKLHWKLKNS